nr:hypothetical protein GCM10025732_54360 [Glycomyces mayteni]
MGGIGIDPVTGAGAVARVLDAIDAGRGGQIVTPNVDIVAAARRSRALRAVVNAADLVTADGAPLVWASRVAGTPLPERVAGSDLVWSLAEAAARRGLRVALLGGTPDAAARPTERAAEILETRYPGLKVVGAWCPPMGFDRDDAHWSALTQRLAAAAPDLVYVGLGFPKQEHVIVRLRATAPGRGSSAAARASTSSPDTAAAPRDGCSAPAQNGSSACAPSPAGSPAGTCATTSPRPRGSSPKPRRPAATGPERLASACARCTRRRWPTSTSASTAPRRRPSTPTPTGPGSSPA